MARERYLFGNSRECDVSARVDVPNVENTVTLYVSDVRRTAESLGGPRLALIGLSRDGQQISQLTFGDAAALLRSLKQEGYRVPDWNIDLVERGGQPRCFAIPSPECDIAVWDADLPGRFVATVVTPRGLAHDSFRAYNVPPTWLAGRLVGLSMAGYAIPSQLIEGLRELADSGKPLPSCSAKGLELGSMRNCERTG